MLLRKKVFETILIDSWTKITRTPYVVIYDTVNGNVKATCVSVNLDTNNQTYLPLNDKELIDRGLTTLQITEIRNKFIK